MKEELADTPDHLTPDEKNREIEREILGAISGIRYGSVEIIIHDSKVVQIERKEKVRFDLTNSGRGR